MGVNYIIHDRHNKNSAYHLSVQSFISCQQGVEVQIGVCNVIYTDIGQSLWIYFFNGERPE